MAASVTEPSGLRRTQVRAPRRQHAAWNAAASSVPFVHMREVLPVGRRTDRCAHKVQHVLADAPHVLVRERPCLVQRVCVQIKLPLTVLYVHPGVPSIHTTALR